MQIFISHREAEVAARQEDRGSYRGAGRRILGNAVIGQAAVCNIILQRKQDLQ